MQIQAVNRRAKERYSAFVTSMDLVLEAMDGLTPLIEKVDDRHEGPGWTVATQDELTGYRQQALDALERLRAAAKKYETELVSRDWRV
ncbi:hypothetical protein SAMN05421835_105149 [Amycolatopsis sacchari]|uniref:WXG100 family type VII secretion target n=1 Tax=Amycolatopsis sacchari TaxID=115433 RepID=A0A1I3R593_9PSEU|nr:hypothetical protein [Amycolatopsis sacchari]SFJ41528.1 hypothetical protein SAMN05421835_105149 [Amycolatopsis sacchari]